mgnify:CR=1 FL=1
MTEVTFTLNGKIIAVKCVPGTTLLEYLRQLEMYSVKYGCDDGTCGACTVLIDGKTQNACLTMVGTLQGKTIDTLEGLNEQKLVKSIQERFLTEGAIQCGYCTPGMILSLTALLRENEEPSEVDIRDAISGNYCRCTGYVKPIKAMLK